MLFRFSISKTNGTIAVYDEPYRDEHSAFMHVKWLCWHSEFVVSVTLHRHLDCDCCGPIQRIGTFILDGDQVINRETKQAL